jgi:hypothetical protein
MTLTRGAYCSATDLYFWKNENGKPKWVTKVELEFRKKKCVAQTRALRAKDPQKARLQNHKSYHKDVVKSREYQKIWRQKNLDRRRKQQRDYTKNKRASDPLFLVKSRLKVRTSSIFKRKNISKRHNTLDILGCDWPRLKDYIESKFSTGMGWDNRSLWHIDHIIPLASAETEQRLIELCHYTNLQPLWASENMSKGAKIKVDYLKFSLDTTSTVHPANLIKPYVPSEP